ncbi:prepilin peptidase [Bacillus chungangensis]|uniref:Leader peptidase (Prepilin peptidase)/N-methyltransferase n=1 Tax=Bacillus chungangensis TaxID=587633 RepID=A0ABT9WNH0_9BACI|nr:A24 family peptidase [Bacillus chungangensis]MDQ0174330.1 leader peptidase (prepilin peptidase)/N-methyltransferase [Bacillus chungangensis]
MYVVIIFGLVLGSFFNVVGLRIPLQQSIAGPRSACPNCQRNLTPRELIPVLSYLIQYGRCRGCRTLISPLYLLVETMTPLLFVFAFLQIGWNVELMIAWTLISLFMIIFVSDITYLLIPDKLLLFFGGIFLIERILFPLQPWWDSLLGAISAFVLLLLIERLSDGGLGGGDMKLFALIGFVLGTKLVLLSFIVSVILGAFFGLIGLVCGFLKKEKPIAFGPFIGLGTLITYFYHLEIMNWYISLFS